MSASPSAHRPARLTGSVPRQDWFAKGDLTRLKRWVRTRHAERMPIGLYIPFPEAWLAVKEFMKTEGQLPTSIEWVKSGDLPPGTSLILDEGLRRAPAQGCPCSKPVRLSGAP